MSTSIHQQEIDMHLDNVETSLYTLDEPKVEPVYYDFNNPSTFLLTWSLSDKPHQS
jgi:hypothetical protein